MSQVMGQHSPLLGGDIMIVDDNPVNLQLLEEMLQLQSYEVRSFPLGRLALAAATKHPPDLILLDVNMPEMNGYEVCERLKTIPRLAGIPVIFLSALDGTEDKVKAFQSGATDYISKPFQVEEVQARVKTQLSLYHLQCALELQNQNLEQTVAARTRELEEANQRLTILDSSKNDFLSLISHEFRTPLNGMFGAGELLLETMAPTPGNKQLELMYKQSRQRIMSILNDALLLTEIDVSRGRFQFGPVNLSVALHQAVQTATEVAQSRGIALVHPAQTSIVVTGEEKLLVRAIHALLETAIKFSADNGMVETSIESAPGATNVLIKTRGRKIPDSALQKFFDLFSITQALTPGGDLGLGPAVAYRILALFNASVRVANLPQRGIQFTVSLNDAGAC